MLVKMLAGACKLCGFSGEMRAFYPRKSIVQCPECFLVFYLPRDPFDARTLYQKDYFHGHEYFDYTADKSIVQRNFKKRVAELISLKPGGRLLEVGSAYGFFLELAREHWDVRGVDVTEDGVRFARDVIGVDCRNADFLTADETPESNDLVCFWDTIEHLENPFLAIEKAARSLKPGGYLVATTGDIESLMSKSRGQNWRLIHPPTHLFYFSGKTLRRAFERAGLEVVSVSYVGYARSFRSIAHAIFRGKLSWLSSVVTLGGRVDFPVYLNFFDIFRMVGRKPE